MEPSANDQPANVPVENNNANQSQSNPLEHPSNSINSISDHSDNTDHEREQNEQHPQNNVQNVPENNQNLPVGNQISQINQNSQNNQGNANNQNQSGLNPVFLENPFASRPQNPQPAVNNPFASVPPRENMFNFNYITNTIFNLFYILFTNIKN